MAIDKAEWQYESAQKEYCAQSGLSPAELTEADEKKIWGYVAAFIRGEKSNPWDPDYEITLHKAILEACGLPTE